MADKEVFPASIINIKPFIDNNVIKAYSSESLRNKVVVNKKFAKKNNLKIGSQVKLTIPTYGKDMRRLPEGYLGEFIVIDILDNIPGHFVNIAVDWSSEASKKIMDD
jgi:hypothetical protein